MFRLIAAFKLKFVTLCVASCAASYARHQSHARIVTDLEVSDDDDDDDDTKFCPCLSSN